MWGALTILMVDELAPATAKQMIKLAEERLAEQEKGRTLRVSGCAGSGHRHVDIRMRATRQLGINSRRPRSRAWLASARVRWGEHDSFRWAARCKQCARG